MSGTLEVIVNTLFGLVLIYLIIVMVGALGVCSASSVTVVQITKRNVINKMYGQAMKTISGDWLEKHGFEFAGCFRTKPRRGESGIVGWKHASGSTYFCLYLYHTGQNSKEFLTLYTGSSRLFTSSRADELLIPHGAGCWMQAFHRCSIERMWMLHTEAETFLRQELGYTLADVTDNLDKEIAKAVRCQMDHVRSQLLWPLRIPFWIVTRICRLHGKTIALQVARRSDIEFMM
ncbi:MAG: hypothetical protein R3C45_16585 [Phycisphaerales bacterium]